VNIAKARDDTAIDDARPTLREVRVIVLVIAVVVVAAGEPAAAKPHADAPARVWFVNEAGKRITRETFPRKITIRSNRGRVCVRRRHGGAYCASPETPHRLVRRVNLNLVTGHSRMHAFSRDGSTVLAQASLLIYVHG
jgi:hypothetical protein